MDVLGKKLIIKMGKSQSSQFNTGIQLPHNCKKYSQLPLQSPQDLQEMEELLAKRSYIMKKCPQICSLSSYQVLVEEAQTTDFSCRQKQKIVIFYQPFDYTLAEISIHEYRFTEKEILHFTVCIAQALDFLYSHDIPYGDVCAENICYNRQYNRWMLIDKAFLKNGISAYEKVLEGEAGFITPKQMERIRHGFVRESPQITVSDDIFGLGMVLLQMGSGRDSANCYRESHLRLNQDVLTKNLLLCSEKYSIDLARLIDRMLLVEEQQRIGVKEIIHRIHCGFRSTPSERNRHSKNQVVSSQNRKKQGERNPEETVRLNHYFPSFPQNYQNSQNSHNVRNAHPGNSNHYVSEPSSVPMNFDTYRSVNLKKQQKLVQKYSPKVQYSPQQVAKTETSHNRPEIREKYQYVPPKNQFRISQNHKSQLVYSPYSYSSMTSSTVGQPNIRR